MTYYENAVSKLLASIGLYRENHSIRYAEVESSLIQGLLHVNNMWEETNIAISDRDHMMREAERYQEMIGAIEDHYNPKRTPTQEGFLFYNEGDLVINRDKNSCDVRFVEGVGEDGILLVNGIQDLSYEADELELFEGKFRLLCRVEDMDKYKGLGE